MGKKISILGGGNLGTAMARGFVKAGYLAPSDITITRRHPEHIQSLKEEGFLITRDNAYALSNSEIVIIAVRPEQLPGLIEEIKDFIDEDKHILVSVVTGASVKYIKNLVSKDIAIIRAMPNTAVAICESMTCLFCGDVPREKKERVHKLFSSVGKVLEIPEEYMIPATSLCACGIAFFLRCIRAASQGGIEIGFHSDEAIIMAAQTARGAASILLESYSHPESEIDKVTTPRGCTIAGLNEMEHNGFSSAMIKGIVVSYNKAMELIKNNNDE